jgi:hypothetical protein
MKKMKTKKSVITSGFALVMTVVLAISLGSCSKKESQVASVGEEKKSEHSK